MRSMQYFKLIRLFGIHFPACWKKRVQEINDRTEKYPKLTARQLIKALKFGRITELQVARFVIAVKSESAKAILMSEIIICLSESAQAISMEEIITSLSQSTAEITKAPSQASLLGVLNC